MAHHMSCYKKSHEHAKESTQDSTLLDSHLLDENGRLDYVKTPQQTSVSC